MPSKSKKQARFMAAVAHSRKFAKKAGVPQSVGKEFNRADKRKRKAKDSAMSKFAADEIKHDPHSGQFSSGGGGRGKMNPTSVDKYDKAASHHGVEASKGGPDAELHAKAASHYDRAADHFSKGDTVRGNLHAYKAKQHAAKTKSGTLSTAGAKYVF